MKTEIEKIEKKSGKFPLRLPLYQCKGLCLLSKSSSGHVSRKTNGKIDLSLLRDFIET